MIVIASIRDNYTSTFNEKDIKGNDILFNRANNLDSKWLNVAPSSSVSDTPQKDLDNYTIYGKDGKIFVSQMQLTPDGDYDTAHPDGSSLQYVYFAYSRNVFRDWLTSYEQNLDRNKIVMVMSLCKTG